MGNDCLIQKIDRQLGVRESGGANKGWKVEQYLASVGLPPGNPWCASYVHYNLDGCGIPNTVRGWAPSIQNGKNVVYLQRKFKKVPIPGDVFTIYSIKKGRIAHGGFFRERINEKFYLTNEGNAARDGSLNPYDGDGVYEKIRSFNSTYSITRWAD